MQNIQPYTDSMNDFPVPRNAVLDSLSTVRPHDMQVANSVPISSAGYRNFAYPYAKSALYKTELCRTWKESGGCRYGNKCQFAHGEEELLAVQRHPRYKTELCRTFALGYCPYGHRCRFIHATGSSANTAPRSSAPSSATTPYCALAKPGPTANISSSSQNAIVPFLTSVPGNMKDVHAPSAPRAASTSVLADVSNTTHSNKKTVYPAMTKPSLVAWSTCSASDSAGCPSMASNSCGTYKSIFPPINPSSAVFNSNITASKTNALRDSKRVSLPDDLFIDMPSAGNLPKRTPLCEYTYIGGRSLEGAQRTPRKNQWVVPPTPPVSPTPSSPESPQQDDAISELVALLEATLGNKEGGVSKRPRSGAPAATPLSIMPASNAQALKSLEVSSDSLHVTSHLSKSSRMSAYVSAHTLGRASMDGGPRNFNVHLGNAILESPESEPASKRRLPVFEWLTAKSAEDKATDAAP